MSGETHEDVVVAIRFIGGTRGEPFPYGRGIIDTINRSPGQQPERDDLYAVFSSRNLAIEHLKRHVVEPGFWRQSPYLNVEPASQHSACVIDSMVTTETFFST